MTFDQRIALRNRQAAAKERYLEKREEFMQSLPQAQEARIRERERLAFVERERQTEIARKQRLAEQREAERRASIPRLALKFTEAQQKFEADPSDYWADSQRSKFATDFAIARQISFKQGLEELADPGVIEIYRRKLGLATEAPTLQ